jgi:adenylate cyclase
MKKNAAYKFLIPVGLAVLFAILAVLKITSVLEYRLFDAFLSFRPSPPEDPAIVLVDVDDPAISAIGTWPISRSITANALMLLAEMGAKRATFDIEYTDKSPRGVNSDVLEREIPEILDSEMGQLQSSIKSLFEAVAKKQISVRDAGEYVDDLVGVAEKTKETLKNSIAKIALDNDLYLAEAARFFGDAYFTVNMRTNREDTVTEEWRAAAMNAFALKNIEIAGTGIRPAVDILPVIQPILGNAKGIGFTNAEVDDDGIRRRIMLVQRYDKVWFGQLVLRPLLDDLGNPKITVYPRKIVLAGARIRGGSPADISIPVTADGKVIVDWPHKPYKDSFHHVSFYHLYMHDRLYDNLVQNIRIGESYNYFHAYKGKVPLLELARQASELRTAIMEGRETQTRVADYAALRSSFIAEAGAFLATKPEDRIVKDVDEVLADPSLDAETRAQYEAFKKDVPDFFAKTRGICDNLAKIRSEKFSALAGAFCIVGQTNTGSTDLGANPFAKEYPNIGTHAALVNMILNRRFVVMLSPLLSALIALCAALALSFMTRTSKPSASITSGLATSAGITVAAGAFFSLTGRYLPVLPLVGPIILSFISVTFVTFFITERERGFLKTAFSHYLSADVIKQIIADPGKLKLGGEQRYMTAMFTDIQGFSTVSEKMTPIELVNLLNQYLTGMSDRVLEMGGTIDKYEGDAIIAFFGAPLDLEDHAKKALIAAIRMRRIEAEMNERFLASKLAPSPLKTRFGINTGLMVVGNMGTEKKMNYTIMGDAVNLAARLEGVNKRYGTYMCVSEETMNAAGSGFIFRRLDRIRVVGKGNPIRIFELVEEEGRITESMQKGLARFELALELFEKRDWAGAIDLFNETLKFMPNDGPALCYIKTCNDYIASPPPEGWDGVYNMSVK